jgi:hypothetical protein
MRVQKYDFMLNVKNIAKRIRYQFLLIRIRFFMTEEQRKIATFLTETPLYSKIEISEFVYSRSFTNNNINQIYNLSFDFYCTNCKVPKTFKLLWLGGRLGTQILGSQHCSGTCQYCNTYTVEFLLQFQQDGEKYYLKKIGQSPAFEIKPPKVVYDYLDKDDKSYYSKALMCISQSYGMAAHAYFRRIIENTIRKIIKDATGEDISEVRLIDIKDDVFQHLPSELMELGNNPVKLLYAETSAAIHGLSEDECLKKAQKINTLLSFLITRLNQRKENKEISELMANF